MLLKALTLQFDASAFKGRGSFLKVLSFQFFCESHITKHKTCILCVITYLGEILIDCKVLNLVLIYIHLRKLGNVPCKLKIAIFSCIQIKMVLLVALI